MKIIAERPQDAAFVEALNNEAFGPERFNKTVYRLREGISADAGLSFVALDERGSLVASLRFWPIVIGAARTPAILLGPLAVQPHLRGQGYGKALMRHGIERARALGHRIIVLVGDPEYYNPFGFRRELTLKLALPGPVEERRFLALELQPGALDGVSGMICRAETHALRPPRRKVSVRRA